eukprot:GEMP01051617.1.p1 GENE.GEMP01051617.1~~GEMP01051617.1.p1  ORF type:complete len:153 (+),score=22.92 GEMP01051617.1:31-459(+)
MATDSGAPDFARWQIIYPNYLNSKKTIPEGRRIAVEHCCENPDIREMAEICRFLKIQTVVEPNKAYSRDWLIRGRVRVNLLAHPDYTKKFIMKKMGELIPQLKSRVDGPPKAPTDPVPEEVSKSDKKAEKKAQKKADKKKKK